MQVRTYTYERWNNFLNVNIFVIACIFPFMFVCDVVMSTLEFCVYIMRYLYAKNDILPRMKNCYNFVLERYEKIEKKNICVSFSTTVYTTCSPHCIFRLDKSKQKTVNICYSFNIVHYTVEYFKNHRLTIIRNINVKIINPCSVWLHNQSI